MSLESEVLSRIKPKPDEIERITATAKKLKDVVEKYIEKNNLAATEVRYVGSFAKDTFLSDPDLDLFLMFPPSVSRKQLESEGLRAGEDILNGIRMYSEHPYIRGKFDDLDIDLVPCYHLENTKKLQSSVDRTPFHTTYVLSHLDPKQKDDVRMLKKFMKGIAAYGAEPNTRGFSGYLCELLIIKYGSFLEVIKAGAGWKEGASIEIEGRGPISVAPLTVYDPVDPRRNVASAVHLDTMSLFIVAARAYLQEPSEKFFFPVDREDMTSSELKAKTEHHGSRLLTIIFKRPNVVEDNLYSQLWKTQYALTRKMDEFDFTVLRAVHEMDKDEMRIVFEVERDVLSKTFKHVGPPVWVPNAESFLKKWKDNEYGEPFIEDGDWNVIAERSYTTAKEMISEEAAIAGIGRELDPDTMVIRDHEDTLKDTPADILTELLDPKLSWEN
ncbi:MAG TPA: CCA tRNA nucleotidyltransferase [Candidatus Methanomethylophilaceae archaeon]|nr:CCA tRNA nucleotidyltransferase [Candidatus Methanomethylophilaceae archaeon]